MKVVFVHLDLGIGGAEMLVVNAAVAAKKAGHKVVIYTSHHDERRCFRDTKGNGILAGDIRVRGDWLPRHLVFGRFTAFCAVLRMVWLALCVLWTEARANGRGARGADYDDMVIFCDGVSAPVPLLRLAGAVLFYCHFPDKLLCVERESLLKRIYRWPLDLMEELTTGCASSVAVNSNFTAGIFRGAFPRVGKYFQSAEPHDKTQGGRRVRVLYPPTNVKAYSERGSGDSPPLGQVGPVVSLNRFERKKNLPLGLEALGWAVREMGASEASEKGLRLIVAGEFGGYDDRVPENVEHLKELQKDAKDLKLENLVEFRQNIGDEERSALLREALCVVYTPSREHFGIVPVEAMCSGAPIVAVNSGGPLETVVDDLTGFLCPPTEEAFGAAILKLVRDPSLVEKMGKEGRKRVHEKFSMETFDAILQDLASNPDHRDMNAFRLGGGLGVKVSLLVVAFLVSLAAFFSRG